MKDYIFEDILRSITLPIGVLLNDESTYRITKDDFPLIQTGYSHEFNGLDKFLVVTNGVGIVVGGVLFYDERDIQATVFPEYRGKHFMSAIFKNGILKSECYPNQKVTITKKAITSFDDFLMKHHLASCAGLQITNLSEIHKWFNAFSPCQKYRGFQQCSEDEFLITFS